MGAVELPIVRNGKFKALKKATGKGNLIVVTACR